jgi:hypothetical protein
MNNALKIDGTIGTSDSSVPLGLEIWIDNLCLLNLEHVTQEQNIQSTYHLMGEDHEIKFILKNKQPEHTKISDTGEIIEDSMLYVKNLKFNDIVLEEILCNLAVYDHDFNGTGTPIADKFFGSLGCNGTVTLKFTTPVYQWLLEHI